MRNAHWDMEQNMNCRISHIPFFPLSQNALKALPWSIACPTLQCFSLGRSCSILKFTLSAYFVLSRNGPVRTSASQKSIGNDTNMLKPTHTRAALIWHYALNLPEASLGCSRFWGLRRQKVSPKYVLSHPSKIGILTSQSINFWLGYQSLICLSVVCTDGHSYNSHGLIIWLIVTLYDNSNNDVAKRFGHCYQLILAVEDVKLDKPKFLPNFLTRNRQSFLHEVRQLLTKCLLGGTSAHFLGSQPLI